MENNSELFEQLYADGFIGEELYKIVSYDYEDSDTAIVAGAALEASHEAYENAKRTNLPLVMKEGDFLNEISSDGSKKVIKSFAKNVKHFPKKFILK